MSQFENTEWATSESWKGYHDNADNFLLERQTLLQILTSFYRKHLGVGKHNRTLDLGCGDGIIGATLYSVDDSIRLIEVDGSPEMISAARKRLQPSQNAEYHLKTFQRIISESPAWTSMDFVVSSFAIHHLDADEKSALCRRVSEMLKQGGFFVNIDVVLPHHQTYEDWYYSLWVEWIAERQRRLALDSDFTNVPSDARRRPENKYQDLESQMEMLRSAGFCDVECYYRYGLFGIYGGRKPLQPNGTT